jgi:hypothetical protein
MLVDSTVADPPRTCLPVPDRLAPTIASGPLRARRRTLRTLRAPIRATGLPHGRRTLVGQSRSYWRNGDGRRVRRPTENILDSGKWTPVMLACAHLNHDPSDSALNQLAALCPRCHMIYDGPEHRRRRWMNAHYRRALGDLFYGPYPMRGADWITPTPISMLGDSRSLYANVR